VGGGQEFDPDILKDITKCLVAPYIAQNVGVFQCPSDQRYGIYDGTVVGSPLIGKRIKCARSVSQNQAVGSICDTFWGSCQGHSGRPNKATHGPWLTGMHTCSDSTWATFGKTSDFRTVSSSKVFLTVDESPYSINDGGLAISMDIPKWVDYPATFHNNGCGFSFCDGHAETHHWKGTTMVLTHTATGQTPVSPNDPDWLWMMDHTTGKR
jgi:prepilin-type processing-associated H-X9-DG protein